MFIAVFPKLRVGTCYSSQDILTLGHSRWPVCSFNPDDLFFGSFEVIWGDIHFLLLTFDRTEIEHWEWSQCVCLAQTHRLICNMTYLAREVTSGDLDLRITSDINLLRATCAYFDVTRREEHVSAKCMSLALSVQKLFAISFRKKSYFDTFWPLYHNLL